MGGDEIERAVRGACVAGALTAVVMLGFAMWRASAFGIGLGVAFVACCSLVMFGLVYGTARYSRACSTALLGLFVCGLVALAAWASGFGSVVAGIVGVGCVFVLVRGVQATFARHHIERAWSRWQVSLEHSLDPRLMNDEKHH